MELIPAIKACTLCADDFGHTATAHEPRPVVWFKPQARLLIVGQAPGLRVHESGVPFDDRSGDRLRDWLGLTRDEFYDREKVAIIPMAFCFPGYSTAGSDLPPPAICAKTWRSQIMDHLTDLRLTLLIGGYAQKWHLGADKASNVTGTVQNWRDHLPNAIPCSATNKMRIQRQSG